jgi:hypothetical protein
MMPLMLHNHLNSMILTVAKRLKCIKTIVPGEREHLGSHSHSNDQDVFHFCTTRSVEFLPSVLSPMILPTYADARVVGITALCP